MAQDESLARKPAWRDLLATLLGIGQTRLQIAVIEVEEERLHLARLALDASLTYFCLGLGIILAVSTAVLACPAAYRPWVAGASSGLFLSLGAWRWLRWRADAAAKPAMLASTMAELSADQRFLRGVDQ